MRPCGKTSRTAPADATAIDKDDHLRTAQKYLVLTLPDRAKKMMQQQIQEAVRPVVEQRDITSAAIRAEQIKPGVPEGRRTGTLIDRVFGRQM